MGGVVRLTSFPALGLAWYWAYVVTPDVGCIVVRDHEVPLPRRSDFLEVRADGLWAELVCEHPFEHWGLAAEAFGLRLDDPLDVIRDPGREERGERMPVGLDLEWELIAPVADLAAFDPAVLDPSASGPSGRYSQAGWVHGTVLVGPAEIAVDGFGVRTHRWGSASEAPVQRIAGASGTAAFEVITTGDSSTGWSWVASDPEVVAHSTDVSLSTEADDDGMPRRVHSRAPGGFECRADVVAVTAAPMGHNRAGHNRVGPDRSPMLRALGAVDGDPAWVWVELS